MKKCKIKAPKYAFGAQQISGLLQAGGNIAQGFNSGNQTAQAVFSGVDAVGDAIPIPMVSGIVKGVAGLGKAVTSIVGTKGSVDEVTGEITEGTGILGRKNKSKLRQQSGIVKNNIAAAQNSQQLAADYYQQHGYNGITMVANGGIIPNTLAYLDDGELIRTPDGTINEIPEEGKPEDSNLMNVPVGTQVLSDKLKIPGTNKTFAERGKEIMATKKQKGKDKYAENSAILNARNSQIAYDELLALQESIKKGKDKKTNKYANGTKSIKWSAKDRVRSSSDFSTNEYVTDTIPVDYVADQFGNMFRKDYKGFDERYEAITNGIDVTGSSNTGLPDYRIETRRNPNFTVDFANRLAGTLDKNASDYLTPVKFDAPNMPVTKQNNFDNVYIFGTDYKGNSRKPLTLKDNSYYLGSRNPELTTADREVIDTNKGMAYWLGSRNYEPSRRISKNTGSTKNTSSVNFSMFENNLEYNPDLMRIAWTNDDVPQQNQVSNDEIKEPVKEEVTAQKPTQAKAVKKTKGTKPVAAKPVVPETPETIKGKVTPYTAKKTFGIDVPKQIQVPRQTPYVGTITSSPENKTGFDVSGFIDSLVGASAGLIGPISNMTAKRGETNVPYMYTPKYGPTEWNIDPMLTEINRSNAIARYNQSRLSPNTGAGLAFGIQSAVARNEAMSRAYAEKNNMENQMAMQNAGIYNDAARYNAQARHQAAVENAQDRAAVDNARRLGLSQLGTALQTMSKDKRLSKRDTAMLNAMIPYLEYGMTREQLTTLLNDLR